MEILSRNKTKIKVSKSNLAGYGKISIGDKALGNYVGKEVEIDITIREV